MIYEKILTELERNDIKYLVIGGVAVNLYGYQRITKDLDIMLSFEKENMEKFVKIVKTLGLKPKAPVEPEELANKDKRDFWIREKNMKVFSFYNPENDLEYIDIMILDHIDFDEAYLKKRIMHDGRITTTVISIDDLITLKEIASRPRDNADLEVLKKIKEKYYG